MTTAGIQTGIKPLPGRPEDYAVAAERFVPAAARPPAAAPREVVDPTAGPFGGTADVALLEHLRSGQLQSAELGPAGRTLAFKVALESGVQAYYKPEQRTAGANWYAEVAAFYLDRALGLGRVPPVVSRRWPWRQLQAAAAGDSRNRTVVIGRDGSVRGALIAWLPEKLVPAETPPGWEDWLRDAADPWDPLRVTPYQDAAAYTRALNEQRKRRNPGTATVTGTREPPQPGRKDLPAELSDLIVFDFLTSNADRFGGGNANLLTRGDKGPLIFLDNGSAFPREPSQQAVLGARLSAVSKFRRRTVDALRALDIEALKATIAADPLGPLLLPAIWRGFEARRVAVLEHVAQQAKRFGDAVYAW